jgi:uncharacterized membrane protein YfcA
LDLLIIGIIAFLTSILAGMLGLGGAVILIPAYLYLPTLFGIEPLGVKFIAGMTSFQVFCSAMMGLFFHRRKGSVNSEIILKMGVPILFASFLGAFLSGSMKPEVILGVFAIMAITGAGLMFLKKGDDTDHINTWKLNTPLAAAFAGLIGFFGGIAGAPGAFILAPLMITVLKVPTRVTIGSTLGIVLLSAGSVSIGKLITGQVPPMETFTAVAASFPGVWLGSIFSYRLNVKMLRIIMAILISAAGIEMWYNIFFH